MAFTTLMLFQLFNVFNARSDERSAFAAVHEPLAVGGGGLSLAAAGRGDLRAVSPAGVFDGGVEGGRLASLHAGRELGVMVARVAEDGGTALWFPHSDEILRVGAST